MSAASNPSMSVIGARQDSEFPLKCRVAARNFYAHAKSWHFAGTSLAIAFALISPVILIFRPGWGAGFSAAAGLWIFLGRALLEPWTRSLQFDGTRAAEVFDCEVLSLPWNDALSRRMSDEEITLAARGDVEPGLRTWYPTDTEYPWPESVLRCQRANTVWARGQHRSYSGFVKALAVGWLVVTAVIALWQKAKFGDYLVVVALPSLPAWLEAVDVVRGHVGASESRQLVEDDIESHLVNGRTTINDLREIQNQLFTLRRAAPLVPEWYYRKLQPRYEAAMRYATRRRTDDDQADEGADG
jgi:hypothetical protein